MTVRLTGREANAQSAMTARDDINANPLHYWRKTHETRSIPHRCSLDRRSRCVVCAVEPTRDPRAGARRSDPVAAGRLQPGERQHAISEEHRSRAVAPPG